MSDEHEYEHEDEVREIGEQMKDLAVRGAVLAARDAAKEVTDHVSFPLDLRSFLAGMVAQQAMGHPEAVGHILDLFEPELARVELEAAAADTDHFKDLPIYEGPEGES